MTGERRYTIWPCVLENSDRTPRLREDCCIVGVQGEPECPCAGEEFEVIEVPSPGERLYSFTKEEAVQEVRKTLIEGFAGFPGQHYVKVAEAVVRRLREAADG